MSSSSGGSPPPVGRVPAGLGLNPSYQKYVDALGIPVISSGLVPDAALIEARDIVLGMLDRAPEITAALIANGVHAAVMAESEVTTDIPEYSDLYTAVPGTDWNERARGLGATSARPVTSGAEENLLCYAQDKCRGENIFLHEFAHTILDLGIAELPTGSEFVQRVQEAYANSASAGLWAGTYAATDYREYWAEAVQSWFDANQEPDGAHNDINTRRELIAYDPTIANLIAEILPTNWMPSCP